MAAVVLAVLLGPVVDGLSATAASAQEVVLPRPVQAGVGDLLGQVGARPDRLLVSVTPGPVRNDEVVRVGLGPGGAVQVVRVEQRLRLTGEGDYQVRERGPARAARSLGEEPAPVTKFGAVVWQGFSPGMRDLAALLTLDPVLEEPRLPLAVGLTFQPPGGPARDLGPQGVVPGAGTVTVRLRGRTALPATLPTASATDLVPVATALDAARAQALRAGTTRLPTAGGGLPVSVPAGAVEQRPGRQALPLRLTGLLRAEGATASGPGTTPVPGGVRLAGTLPGDGEVVFTLTVPGPTALELDLQAVPALDPRALLPPGGAASWVAWAASDRPAAERRAALDLLVDVAATGARAAAYAPYLGADLPGTGSTVFRWTFAPAPEAVPEVRTLQVRPRAVALAGAALLLLVGAAAGVWRQS